MKDDQSQYQSINLNPHMHSSQLGAMTPVHDGVSANTKEKTCGRLSPGVKETGILMKGPLVLATQAGIKTQTRRVIKPQPKQTPELGGFGRLWFDGQDEMHCPYGQAGDRLWVRETWRYCCLQRTPDGQRAATVEYDVDLTRRTIALRDADKEPKPRGQRTGERCEDYVRYLNKWWARNRRSMFMPRWASRITLEITGIRVERLQDISEADAIAEGIERTGRHWKSYSGPGSFCRSPISSYQTLWESINGAGSWAANPWVWVVEFKRV